MGQTKSGKAPEKRGITPQEQHPEAYCALGNIEWLSKRHGTTDDDLARAMGCSRQTLNLRREEPWEFRMREYENIAKLWGLTVQQLLAEPMLPKIRLEYDGE